MVALSGSVALGLATQQTPSVAIVYLMASSACQILNAASAFAIRIPACALVVYLKAVPVIKSNTRPTTAAAILALLSVAKTLRLASSARQSTMNALLMTSAATVAAKRALESLPARAVMEICVTWERSFSGSFFSGWWRSVQSLASSA